MSLLQAIIMGIIQGATEFLPVSSAAAVVVICRGIFPETMQTNMPRKMKTAKIWLSMDISLLETGLIDTFILSDKLL